MASCGSGALVPRYHAVDAPQPAAQAAAGPAKAAAGHPPPHRPYPPLDRHRHVRELAAAQRRLGSRPLRVFAYGSLIWRPGFRVAARWPALLCGHRVACCVWTVQARGSPGQPGLGLGLLSAPGDCAGFVIEAQAQDRAAALASLWAREMLTGVYRPCWLRSGDQAEADTLAFVVDVRHPQYAGMLSVAQQARYIASAHGELGSNAEYLHASVAALASHGLAAADLLAVDDAVRRLR